MTQSDGSSSAICMISLRFFSPPEKPTLSGRRSISWVTLSRSATSRTLRTKSGVESSASPRALRWALSADLQERHGGDAGDLDRILEGEEDAGGGALVRLHLEQVLAR